MSGAFQQDAFDLDAFDLDTGPLPMSIQCMRAITSQLAAALGSVPVTVERERQAALTQADLPRVLVYAGAISTAEELIGAEMRMVRIQVEAVDAARSTDTAGALQERVTLLYELARDAVLADRTLGLESVGVFVREDAEPRGQFDERAEGLSRAFVAECWYV